MSLSVPQIVLLVWFGLAAIINILAVGEERKPTTPGQAALSLVLLSGLSFLVVIA